MLNCIHIFRSCALPPSGPDRAQRQQSKLITPKLSLLHSWCQIDSFVLLVSNWSGVKLTPVPNWQRCQIGAGAKLPANQIVGNLTFPTYLLPYLHSTGPLPVPGGSAGGTGGCVSPGGSGSQPSVCCRDVRPAPPRPAEKASLASPHENWQILLCGAGRGKVDLNPLKI